MGDSEKLLASAELLRDLTHFTRKCIPLAALEANAKLVRTHMIDLLIHLASSGAFGNSWSKCACD